MIIIILAERCASSFVRFNRTPKYYGHITHIFAIGGGKKESCWLDSS